MTRSLASGRIAFGRHPLAAQRLLSAMGAAIVLSATHFAGEAHGQTVQLPTFHEFSVGTTVSVPDRGAAYLGGVYGARESSVQRGIPLTPFRNRAIGRSATASSASVHAWIIDHAELDAAVLAEARARREASYGPYRIDPVVAAEGAYLGAHVGHGGLAATSPSTSGVSVPNVVFRARPAGPHAAASIHAGAAQESAAAASLADKLFRSEVDPSRGKAGRQE